MSSWMEMPLSEIAKMGKPLGKINSSAFSMVSVKLSLGLLMIKHLKM